MNLPKHRLRKLKRILETDEAYEILDMFGAKYTWLKGGCLLLARALQRLIGDKAIICVIADDRSPHQHAVVKYDKFYLDGDGMSTEYELIRRWTYEENCENPRIVTFDETLVENWHWTQEQEDALLQLLIDKLGDKSAPL